MSKGKKVKAKTNPKYVNPRHPNALFDWVHAAPSAAAKPKKKTKAKKVRSATRVSQRDFKDRTRAMLDALTQGYGVSNTRINNLDDEMAKLDARVRELEDALVNGIGDAVAHAIKQCEYRHHRLSEGVIDEPCSCCHHHVSYHHPEVGCTYYNAADESDCHCKALIKTEAQAPTKGVATIAPAPPPPLPPESAPQEKIDAAVEANRREGESFDDCLERLVKDKNKANAEAKAKAEATQPLSIPEK